MMTSDWLIVIAILFGPVIAVQLTRHLDEKKEQRQRRLQIFKTLMTTRGSPLSYLHVESLNRIDLEFKTNKKSDHRVIEAWDLYLDLLLDKTIPGDQWIIRRIDLLIDLLYKMAETLDYSFDKTRIKNSSYSPQMYGDIELFQGEFREAMRGLMTGERAIPVWITNVPTELPPDEQDKQPSELPADKQDKQP